MNTLASSEPIQRFREYLLNPQEKKISKLLPALTAMAFAATFSFNAAAEKPADKYGAHGTHESKEHKDKSKAHVEHDEAHAKASKAHAEKDEAHAKKVREDYEKGKEKK